MRWRRADTLALGVYGLLTLVTTFPLILHVTTAVPGSGDDAWLFYWNIWWTKVAVLERGISPLHTVLVRFPYGADLRFHTLNLLQDVLALPVAAISITAAYNLIVFAGFTLGGFAAFRLCAWVLGNGRSDVDRPRLLAALIGGCVFAFSTYQFTQLRGHLDMVSAQWLPFAALFLLRTLRERGWTAVLGCGAFYGATALTSEYYLVAISLFTILAIVHGLATRTVTAGWLWRLTAAAGVAIVLASPILIGLVQHPAAAAVSDPAYDVDRFSVDVVAFVTPSRLHPLWSHVVGPVYRAIERGGAGDESIAYLGLVAMALSVAAARRGWPGRGLWFAGTGLFALLAMGPVAHGGGHVIGGWLTPVMPYRWLVAIPLRNIPRVPARFTALTMLCLSVVASQGALFVLRAVRPTRMIAVAAALIALVSLDNATAPTPLASTAPDTVPAVYRAIATDRRNSAVLDVPISDEPSAYPERMLFQTVHRHPVYGGYLSRGTAPLHLEAIPGFSLFSTLSPSMDDVVVYDAAAADAAGVRLLRAYSAGYVVIDKGRMSPADVAKLRDGADRLLGVSGICADDDRTLCYRVPDGGSAPRSADVWLDTGWSYLERGAGSSGDRWRWIADQARVGVLGPAGQQVRLAMQAHALARSRRIRLSGRGAVLATCTILTASTVCLTEPFEVDERPVFVTIESLDGAERAGTADPRRLSVAISSLRLVAPQRVE